MMMSFFNIGSLLALAVAGAGLVISARRLLIVIRSTERRLSRTVDEKNMIAAALRHAKREDTAIRGALEEADSHIRQMTDIIAQAESRIERLRAAPRRTVTMLDRQWTRFDRLWSIVVTNPTLASGRSGGGSWNDGKVLYGFARSGDDLRLRAGAQYPPGDGFLLGASSIVDLADDGDASVALNLTGSGQY
jgi:ABC-type transporter Mla subunit MlaD